MPTSTIPISTTNLQSFDMKDLRQLDDYEKQRFAACETLAREFLATKIRQKCYQVDGSDIHSEGEIERTCILPLTDEQVKDIKAQMIDVANKLYKDEPVSTWEEFVEVVLELNDSCYWDELNSTHGIWNDLILNVVERYEMSPYYIDLDTIRHLYHFSAFVYDTEKGEISGPHKFAQDLSDEEYIFLLALQMSVREGFTYNSLFKINPEFAQRLNRNIDFSFFDIDCLGNQTKPFLILFDEIVDDANSLKEERDKRLKELMFK